MPGKRSESVFLETWHALPKVAADPIDWNLFIQLKAAVAPELEKLRVAGTVGGSLDAEVEVFARTSSSRSSRRSARSCASC